MIINVARYARKKNDDPLCTIFKQCSSPSSSYSQYLTDFSENDHQATRPKIVVSLLSAKSAYCKELIKSSSYSK